MNRPLILKQLRQWGGPPSDAILEPDTLFFHLSSVEGFIGYRIEYNTAIVYGDPVCEEKDKPLFANAFAEYCQKQKLGMIYIIASDEFTKWAIKNTCKAAIQYGNELTLDPKYDPRERTGTHASLVRRKIKHAQGEGLQISEYTKSNPLQEDKINQVADSWLKARKGPQVHISTIRLFEDRYGKRWFYAHQGEHIVGVVLLNRLESREGWLLNHLMFSQDAPHGTPEYLVVAAIEALKNENCPYINFGVSPTSQLGEIIGLSKMSEWISRHAFKTAKWFFHLDGHMKFWEKFHPESKPSFLLFKDSSISPKELLALKKGLNITLS